MYFKYETFMSEFEFRGLCQRKHARYMMVFYVLLLFLAHRNISRNQ